MKGIWWFFIAIVIIVVFVLIFIAGTFTGYVVSNCHEETVYDTVNEKQCDLRNNCECTGKSWLGLGECNQCECRRTVTVCD